MGLIYPPRLLIKSREAVALGMWSSCRYVLLNSFHGSKARGPKEKEASRLVGQAQLHDPRKSDRQPELNPVRSYRSYTWPPLKRDRILVLGYHAMPADVPFLLFFTFESHVIGATKRRRERHNMDAQVEAKYREIFTDLTLDSEEAQELIEYFSNLNPPPDKLVWLRATAFRLGSEFLSDDTDKNVSLIRAINAIVHCLEKTCMVPAFQEGDGAFDAEGAEAKIRSLYEDLAVDADENEELFEYFQENTPPEDDLVALRATAFKAAVDFLSDDKEKNVALLRCINVVVHAFERVALRPKEYKLKLSPEFDLTVPLRDAVQELWKLDVNRLTADVDYKINVQGGKKPYWKEDNASDPLFTYVDKSALRRPTYRTFMDLLDNYKSQTGTAERVTSSEKKENWDFLNAIMETAPMQFCHKYLHSKIPDKVPPSQQEFKELLYDIWFDLYKRTSGGPLDSSGFEHVFVGEVKNGKISGFHNWIQLYMEEQKGDLDYRGYIKPRGRSEAATDSNDHVLTLQFSWHGVEKSVGTSFIGVSPEFEMAVYSMCFLLGEENNEVVLNTGTDEFVLNIKCYTFNKDKIGTSFPEATSHYD
eukprot:scaffold1820_cov129-Cylindrotheca_fusiformis.AAC.15